MSSKRVFVTIDGTCLSYEPSTGKMFRKLTRQYKDSPAGSWREIKPSKAASGYMVVGISGNTYLAHRVAVFAMTGAWPSYHVDHTNFDRTDNRWKNLLVVTQQENNLRMRPKKNKASKFKGVSATRSTGKWVAQISIDGKSNHIGTFANEEDAAKAFDQAAVKLRGRRALTNKELGLYGK